MNPNRMKRLVGVGLAVLVVGLVGARSAWQGDVPPEPSPGEVILEDAAVLAEANQATASAAGEIRWDLPATRNDRVEFWIDFLQGRNYDNTRLWLERSGRYEPLILQELRARDMPEDLLYFAMIESGFSPRAYSRAAAVGIWQFIAETGRRYGLEVSPYVDERRDPVRSTTAALEYLVDMHDDFGSWYLAAAGYNSGENRVDRILRQQFGGARGDEELYWKISEFLPRETRDYVPLMIAAGYIAKDPERYGFHGLEYQAPLAYEEVRVEGGISFETIAGAAGVPERAVSDLNPHLVRGMTPPGRRYPVRIPTGTRQAFAANFDRLRTRAAQTTTVEHRVARGETLSHIARDYRITVAAIRQANEGVSPQRIQPGQVLRIPGVAATAGGAAAEGSSGDGWTIYRVRSGDTLWGIARRHNMSVRQLQALNEMAGSTRIRPGQQLRISA